MTTIQNLKRYQIFDIKQLAELERKHKDLCRQALEHYKIWQSNFKKQSDQMAIYYGEKEGYVLKHHARNTIRNYWRIRNDFRAAFDVYLAENCVIGKY